MELFQELLLTLLVAVFFSFFIAKLVSMATGGGSGHHGGSKLVSSGRNGDQDGLGNASEEVIMEELNFVERLEARGLGSEERSEFVGEAVDKVQEFVGEPAPVEEEIIGSECCDLTEKTIKEEGRKKGGEFSPEEIKEEVVKLAGDHQNFIEQSEEAVEKKEKEIVAGEVKEETSVEETREGEAIGIELAAHNERPEGIGMVEGEPSDKKVEEKKVEIDIDDDWEGIERSELEKAFTEAAKFAESGEGDEKLTSVGSDVQMELYGLHKVATEGPCHEQPPMALKLSARAKWY